MNKSESKYFNTAVRFDEAFLSLLEKKPFEYITIKELCDAAGANRSTFYLHYQNTCDLFCEAIQYVMDRFRYPADERKYVMMFYLRGLTAIITEWLNDGCQKSIEEISAIIHSCIFGRKT